MMDKILRAQRGKSIGGACAGRIHDSRNVVLDCQHLTYIDSTGLNVLADLYRRGRRFVLIAPSPTLRKILGIVGLDMLMPVADSVDEALKIYLTGARLFLFQPSDFSFAVSSF
jgi:anti-anti-sigma regulatory factor